MLVKRITIPSNTKNKLRYYNGIKLYEFNNDSIVYSTILRWNEWKGLDAFTQRSYDGEDYEEYRNELYFLKKEFDNFIEMTDNYNYIVDLFRNCKFLYVPFVVFIKKNVFYLPYSSNFASIMIDS